MTVLEVNAQRALADTALDQRKVTGYHNDDYWMVLVRKGETIHQLRGVDQPLGSYNLAPGEWQKYLDQYGTRLDNGQWEFDAAHLSKRMQIRKTDFDQHDKLYPYYTEVYALTAKEDMWVPQSLIRNNGQFGFVSKEDTELLPAGHADKYRFVDYDGESDPRRIPKEPAVQAVVEKNNVLDKDGWPIENPMANFEVEKVTDAVCKEGSSVVSQQDAERFRHRADEVEKSKELDKSISAEEAEQIEQQRGIRGDLTQGSSYNRSGAEEGKHTMPAMEGEAPSEQEQNAAQLSGSEKEGEAPSEQEQNAEQPSGPEKEGELPVAQEQNAEQPFGPEKEGEVPSEQEQNAAQLSGPEKEGEAPTAQEQNAEQPSGPEKEGEALSEQEQNAEQPLAPEKEGEAPSEQEQNAEQPSGPEKEGEAPSAQEQNAEQPSGREKEGEAPTEQEQNASQPSGPEKEGEAPTEQEQNAEQPSGPEKEGEAPSAQEQNAEQPSGLEKEGEAPEEQERTVGQPSAPEKVEQPVDEKGSEQAQEGRERGGMKDLLPSDEGQDAGARQEPKQERANEQAMSR